ncbi:MAG: hypothetical protein ACHQK8_07555 [Bacteroidia bacterium]
MKTQNNRHAFKVVITELDEISNELARPNEDVVTIAVCSGARRALSNLMELFLQHETGDFFENTNLEMMLAECKKFGNEFDKIDLSNVLCHELNETECTGKYCLDLNRVSDCIKIAHQLKEIIFLKLNIKEAELI